MNDKERVHAGEDRGRQDERATAAERAAHRRRETERERASAEPFDHPYPERRAGIRARRHVSEAHAVADAPPGIPGGYGTTGGGQAGATGSAHPPVQRDTTSGTGSAEPGGDDEGR
ncbi:hypothetical protein [Streptomyces sp. NPDC053069]|uniref:hypothetical protein n=1 Tax=Streptomyces sp. NPDC053069 TaxID=3365695 RepID=UPI0037CD60F1